MRLFHISESPNIEVFHPRPAKRSSWPDLAGKYVWATDDEMIVNYYFPRNCPRVCWRIGKHTTEEECKQFQEQGNQHAIIAIEEKWKQRLSQQAIYRYEFSTNQFRLIDRNAGYYISESVEYPIDRIAIYHLEDHIKAENTKLLFIPELFSLAEYIGQSSYRFSIIRLRKLE